MIHVSFFRCSEIMLYTNLRIVWVRNPRNSLAHPSAVGERGGGVGEQMVVVRMCYLLYTVGHPVSGGFLSFRLYILVFSRLSLMPPVLFTSR